MTNNVKTRVFAALSMVFPSAGGVFEEDWGPEDIEGWDSLAHLSMVMAVSDAFGIEFGFEEVMEIQTVGDLLRLVAAKVQQ